ncbi:malonyl-CoA-acyl carrier protein transacylase, mitochondrial [Galendromus occidentalis]|uniref:Malonyl-CoA-acyl carrier protein transacylase, mitochondrial n=1 Tax=Galendromus occidentalis TaxID=34638 RepID=A0AAJ6W0M8_9ACAR|nr:malonyl-CoA-acyl carrier protein transacylase, mitochondrial [Galendromus occidentalis]
MAKNLGGVPNVKEMFEYASSVMNYDLLKLCNEGPGDELNMTINCQAAVLVTSLAALEKLKYDNPYAVDRCVVTAGFSVGEYSALVFSGALSFEEAVQVVKVRGEAMQSVSEERESGLLTVFTGPDANIRYSMKLAREWCIEKEGIPEPVCEISNFLSPDCKVIGGDLKALEFLERNGRACGIKRSKRVRVSGAFHTSLMKPARNVLKKILEQVEVREPAIEVISNVSARAHRSRDGIRKALLEHICSPVQWEQTMHHIYTRDRTEEYPQTYEVGPGKTLRPLLRALNNRAYSQSHQVQL